MTPPVQPISEQQVELTALELHPDGRRVRLTHSTYQDSACFGPALAGCFPGAAPVRRLDFQLLPDIGGRRQRRAVWELESGGTGENWQDTTTLPPDLRLWAEQALAPDPPRRPHWQRRGGWTALMDWLDAELSEQGTERLGVPQVLKDWGISFLARVPTTLGAVYLKAVPEFFRAEVTVTCTLSHELPGAAAPVLAADRDRGLLLLADAGETLDNGASGWFVPPPGARVWSMSDSRSLMRHLARVQRGAEGLPFLARLPDHGPAWVREQLPHLLAGPLFLVGQPGGLTPEEAAALLALHPRLEAALDRLDASPVPRTLGHGDLHEGNVLVQDGNVLVQEDRYTLLDWSDASLTHPFLDGGPQYLVPEAQRTQAADAYLDAWTDLLPRAQLRSLLQDGVLAGELYRALGYTDGIQPHVADDNWHSAHLHHFRALLRLAVLP